MAGFLVRKLLSVIAVVFMVTAVTWLTFRLLRPEFFAYDQRHVLVQLGDYLQRAFLHLDLGRSWEQPQPAVTELMREGMPADIWLLLGGLGFGIATGVAAGTYVASRPRSLAGRAIEAVSMVFLCAPVYVTGLGLLLLFGAGIAVSGIGLVPVKYVPFGESPMHWLGSMIVPWIVLGLPLAAVCERMMNSSMCEVMHEEFMRTAQAKGIPHRRLLGRHAVPAAVAPVFTLAGVSVPVMVTNMVLVELTFSIPGVFQNVRESMADADFPVIQGTVIAAAVLVALAWLDPKIRAGGT